MDDETLVNKLAELQKKINILEDKQHTSIQSLFDLICVLAQTRNQTPEEIVDALLREGYVALRNELVRLIKKSAPEQLP